MRLVVGVFALSMLGSLAHADNPAPEPAAPGPRARIPLRVVRVMPDSHQALLYDRERSTHVLAEVGGTVEGYTVESIDDDEVSLSRDGKEVVLAAPIYRRAPATAHEADGAPAPAKAAGPAPLDPYADLPAAGEVRVAHAPDAVSSTGPLPPDPDVHVARAPDAGPVRVASAVPTPAAATPATPTPATPATATPATATPATPTPATTTSAAAPTPAAAPSPVVLGPAAPSEPRTAPAPATSVTLARGELDAALADFGALTTQIAASFSPAGLVLGHVNDGTIFQRAGLRSGDVVTAVDGTPLRSLDDAATLYARLSGAHAFTAQLLRGGKPVALHIAIQ